MFMNLLHEFWLSVTKEQIRRSIRFAFVIYFCSLRLCRTNKSYLSNWYLICIKVLEARNQRKVLKTYTKKRLLYQIIKMLSQNKCQGAVLRTDINYSRQYTFVFPGSVSKGVRVSISSGISRWG